MAKIKIDSNLYARAKETAEQLGYSSIDEFVVHLLESEIEKNQTVDKSDEMIDDQLRGLGYID